MNLFKVYNCETKKYLELFWWMKVFKKFLLLKSNEIVQNISQKFMKLHIIAGKEYCVESYSRQYVLHGARSTSKPNTSMIKNIGTLPKSIPN